MLRILTAAALSGALATALLAAPVLAQAPAGRPAPPPPPGKDPMMAMPGAYKRDVSHTSVIVRIGHGNGFSYSTFRIPAKSGMLSWDPAHIDASKVMIVMDPKSIMTPVAGFGDELGGAQFLNVVKFPEASFVSTGIRRTGPTKGMIMGDLTMLGQTRPITIEGELVGAGKNGRGVSVVGFTGMTHFKRSDFGFTMGAPMIGDEVTLLIDTEFDQTAG
jgi:polyisoprenoid-binding protein YceI